MSTLEHLPQTPIEVSTRTEAIPSDDPLAEELLSRLNNSPRLNTDWEDIRHVVAKHVHNGWAKEPSDLVSKMLEQRYFLDTQPINRTEKPKIKIKAANSETPIEIPVDLIVGAQGFASWAGRSEHHLKHLVHDGLSQNVPSLDAIKYFASLDTPAPPVKDMEMYLQPNGKVFLSNHHDGSHRIAAAILRGDKTLPTYNISIHSLETDYIN
jgi:hypothetical protein